MIHFEEHVFQMGWFNHHPGLKPPSIQSIMGLLIFDGFCKVGTIVVIN